MAVLDSLRGEHKKPAAIPKDIQERLTRGRERMRVDAPKRNECLSFWRGDHYAYVNSDNYLVRQGVVIGAKPSHRVRQSWNLIQGIVEAKVSAATQRMPAYEVSPTTTDDEDQGASNLAKKVAAYGFDKWDVRRVTKKVVTLSLVMGEGFAMPYFDPTVPPFIDDQRGIGEVRIKVIGPNECYWEPGVDFMDAGWHVIEQARPIEEVYALPGYRGGKLEPNAERAEALGTPPRQGSHNLVLVTEYLERPSVKHHLGRRLVFCNDKQILDTENYPCAEYEGFDTPIIHRLSYTIDPQADRDRGLVEHLIDPARTFDYVSNKGLEWIAMALAPQVVVQPGVLGRQKVTDEPGAVYQVPDPQNNFKWRDVPQVPPELRMMKQDAQAVMREISASNDIPSQVESSKAIQSLIERDSQRWQSFLTELADFHSNLMRHSLVLVQKHYTEPRLLKIRGRMGPETLDDFRGADLRSQVDVTVLPGSIEPRTQAAIEARVRWFAEMGWVTPQAAMAAVNGGTAEALIESYELDVKRAHKVIQKIKRGPEVLFDVPPRVDQQTGEEIPGWMPREFDKVPIQMQVFEDWMKTDEYDQLPPEQQHATDLYYEGLKHLKAKAETDAMMAQTAQAQQLGMSNAAKPQAGKQIPSLPEMGDRSNG